MHTEPCRQDDKTLLAVYTHFCGLDGRAIGVWWCVFIPTARQAADTKGLELLRRPLLMDMPMVPISVEGSDDCAEHNHW